VAVLIRLAAPEDGAALAAVYAPYVTDSSISFEDAAPDGDEMARRILGERPGFHPWLIAQEAETVLGYAASSPFRSRRAYRWVVETGVYLAPEAQGRGLGRMLLSALLERLAQQGYVAAIGAIALPNDASVALHEKLGFVRSGTYREVGFKFGEWLDVGLWQKELAPRSLEQPEPRPFG
jgi:phosphinothricin acetyltransferase